MAAKHKSKKTNKITKYAIFVVIAAVLFMMYFGTGGNTAKFFAAQPTQSSGSTSVVTGSPQPVDTGIGGTSGSQGNALLCPRPGIKSSCYTGPSGTENVGVCKAGTQTCGYDRQWGPCIGEVKPSAETCADKKDNDCDGLTDCADRNECYVDLTPAGATKRNGSSLPLNYPTQPSYTYEMFVKNKGSVKAGPSVTFMYFDGDNSWGYVNCTIGAIEPGATGSCVKEYYLHANSVAITANNDRKVVECPYDANLEGDAYWNNGVRYDITNFSS